jgi:anti-anti-sigma factor
LESNVERRPLLTALVEVRRFAQMGRDGFEMRRARDPDGVLRLELTGELDLSVARELGDQLKRLAREEPVARVDLSRIEFMDLPALRAVIRAVEEGRGLGCRATVTPSVCHAVGHLVEVAGVQNRLWPSHLAADSDRP